MIIGDVTGKGLQAATVTSMARHSTRFMCRSEPRPSAVQTLLQNTGAPGLWRQSSEG